MNENLVVREVEKLPATIDNLIDKSNAFYQISTRAADVNSKYLVQFDVFDSTKLEKIAEDMTEINRATKVFGRKNTQTTNKLMTLTMLAGASPYRVLHQCLAQIEVKRAAVKENIFKLQKNKIKLQRLMLTISKETYRLNSPSYCEDKEDLQYYIDEKEIELKELASTISDSILYIEGALKEIASFQSAYKQICKNKNIPENWDERDFEKAEIRHHVRMAFLHTYRDIAAHGSIGMGTLEYLQQFGINPSAAFKLTIDHISKEKRSIKEENGLLSLPSYEFLEAWLDDVEELFADSYKQVIERIGLDELHEEWYMYVDPSRILADNIPEEER